MGTELPIIFRGAGGDNRFNFDWFDYAAGAGYKTFYCCAGKNDSGAQYFLTTEQIASDNDNLSTGALGVGTVEVNFDVTFNNPVTIAAADCLIEFTGNANAANDSGYVIATIYHVNSAAVETSLGTVQSATITSAGGASMQRKSMKVALTKKAFGIGEKLRAEIQFVVSNASVTFYYDPSSRTALTEGGTGASIPSDIRINVPFVVDL